MFQIYRTVLGVPKGMKKRKWLRNTIQWNKNFWGKYGHPNKAHKTPNRHGQKSSSQQDIMVKFSKTTHKKKILKLAIEKHQTNFKGTFIR